DLVQGAAVEQRLGDEEALLGKLGLLLGGRDHGAWFSLVSCLVTAASRRAADLPVRSLEPPSFPASAGGTASDGSSTLATRRQASGEEGAARKSRRPCCQALRNSSRSAARRFTNPNSFFLPANTNLRNWSAA